MEQEALAFSVSDSTVYSGTTLLWAPGRVSCMERCPHFRGQLTKEGIII